MMNNVYFGEYKNVSLEWLLKSLQESMYNKDVLSLRHNGITYKLQLFGGSSSVLLDTLHDAESIKVFFYFNDQEICNKNGVIMFHKNNDIIGQSALVLDTKIIKGGAL